MSGRDELSDQMQSLLKGFESRNQSRWKKDMKLMIEESVSRILEEVLSRKLQEVGFVASEMATEEHRESRHRVSSMGVVRSWAAGQAARTWKRPTSASSIGARTCPSVHPAGRVHSGSPQKRGAQRGRSPQKHEVEYALPCCTRNEESHIRFSASQELPGKQPPVVCQNVPAIMISQASDAQASLPNNHLRMSLRSSSASAEIGTSAMNDLEQDMSTSMKYPKSCKVGQARSLTGQDPWAWDPDRPEKADQDARRSVSSRSVSSWLSNPRQQMARIAGQFTRNAMLKWLPARFESSSFFQMVCATIVLHKRFDFMVSVVILANAAFMGISADRQAMDIVEVEPVWYIIVEVSFLMLFAGELLLRLIVYRWDFFFGYGCSWNIFDLLLVKAQLAEAVLYFVSAGSQTMGFVGALRMLRLVRIIRLARILHLMKELRILVSSISNSMRSLAWTLVLMFLMIYSVSLCITQLVTDRRIAVEITGDGELDELTSYFGSLPRSMLSLFEAITGGVDWDVIIVPLLRDVHPLLALVFVIYVAVAMLALMNVVTGVFVDSVLASARADKEQFLLNNAKELFTIAEEEMDWDAFRGKINTPQMLEFFKGIDVDPSEAKDIFTLIDWDQSGTINVEEFLNGCVRLHGPSKALGTAVLHQELRNLRRDLRSHRAENLMLSACAGLPA